MSVRSFPIPSFLLLFFLTAHAMAQDSGIQGVVSDESKAVIPGAQVTVTDIATGVSRIVVTDDVGYFEVPLLADGTYKVTATMNGFRTTETEIKLEVGQLARLGLELKVGEVTEVVEVKAEASLLQTKTFDVGQVIDERRIHELPLNGRNYLQLAQLSAGVIPSGQVGRGHAAADEGAFQAAGIHVAQNVILIDGSDNSSRSSGGAPGLSPLSEQAQAIKPSIDAVGEFKVITNNTSAEYGYRMGAKVLVSTKSGTNEFHGSLYEFYRSDVFGATNFFANRAGAEKPQFIRNQFGATIGGPIVKNRTFFFFSYEGGRIRKGLSATSTVPSAEMRGGDFSLAPENVRNIFDPLTLAGEGAEAQRLPFPNNVVPRERWDPVSAQLFEFYPLPNIAGRESLNNNFFFSPGDSQDADQFDVRVDHNFSDNHRIFGRWSLRDELHDSPGGLPFPAVGASGQLGDIEAQNVALNYNASLGTSTYNELRFGYTWFPTAWDIPFTEDINSQVGLKGGDGSPGYAQMAINTFTSLGPAGNYPSVADLKNMNIADNFLWAGGDHSLKFGVEYRWSNLFRRPNGWGRGWFSFSGQYTSEFPNSGTSRGSTGNPMADFLLGFPAASVNGTPTGEEFSAPYWGFYAQDDWRLSKKLTLNLGLRWELFDGPYYPNAQDQRIARFNFTGDINDEMHDLLPIEFTGYTFPSGDNDCACRKDLDNFAPRIGLAYRLGEKTVIRAGGGIYYGQADDVAYESGRYKEGPPLASVETFLSYAFDIPGLSLSEDGVPGLTVPHSPDIVAPDGELPLIQWAPPFLDQQYTGQWFMDIQQFLPWDTLLTIGYTGSATSHLSHWRFSTAPIELSETTSWVPRRRYPPALAIEHVDNVLNANYNAFRLNLEKRYSGGLTFLSAFTWGHTIDYGREVQAQDEMRTGSGMVSQHLKDMWRNRGNSNLDRRLAYNLSMLWDLPWGKNTSGVLNQVVGGWQVGGILTLLDGTAVNHRVFPDVQNNMGRNSGNTVGDPNSSSGGCPSGAPVGTVDCWFNTQFVEQQEGGTFGDAGRNVVVAPGWNSFDLLASKDFRMPWEGQRLQFRFEAFNLTNTPHFGPPDLNIGRATAGTISAAADPRLIQFALKYVF